MNNKSNINSLITSNNNNNNITYIIIKTVDYTIINITSFSNK